ncbi:DUF4214 domain-containing protein, partial [Ruminococcaceae bacterium OttesenSCG-928-A16]|nr:DUF4214 domain-containing protein [Ruminococcaceae bacterium OttesenSCG-928-A16]
MMRLKKQLSVLLVFLLVLSTFALPVFAGEEMPQQEGAVAEEKLEPEIMESSEALDVQIHNMDNEISLLEDSAEDLVIDWKVYYTNGSQDLIEVLPGQTFAPIDTENKNSVAINDVNWMYFHIFLRPLTSEDQGKTFKINVPSNLPWVNEDMYWPLSVPVSNIGQFFTDNGTVTVELDGDALSYRSAESPLEGVRISLSLVVDYSRIKLGPGEVLPISLFGDTYYLKNPAKSEAEKSIEAFVTRLYQTAMQRTPDASGLN